MKRLESQILALLLLTIGSISCYTPIEGCLDPEATNYSIEADDPCEDCCTYPTIKVNIFHLNEDTTFFLEDTLVNTLDQAYSIVDFVYLLSDFQIKGDDGRVFEVSDSVSLNVADGLQYVKDDVVRVDRGNFSFEFGTTIFEGNVEELSFIVGLPPLLDENRFTTPVSRHPLTTDPDSLFDSAAGTYTYQRIQVAQGENLMDTVIYDIRGQDEVVSINVPVEFTSERGKNKTLQIEALYNRWFDDVDFLTMEKETIESIIKENTGKIFKERE